MKSNHSGTCFYLRQHAWRYHHDFSLSENCPLFPLTPESKVKGWLPLTNSAWMEWACPWWIFPSDKPIKGEAQVFGWRALSPQSLNQSLKDLKLEEDHVVRKIWMSKIGVLRCWGNVISKNLIQAEATMEGSSLLISLKESQMGVLEGTVLLAQGVELSKRSLKGLRWKLKICIKER